jgi:hypothetical protein
LQRHEEVGVAGQHRAHVGDVVEPVTQQHRDRQDDVLLAQAARLRSRPGPRRRGRIDGDDDQAIDLACAISGGITAAAGGASDGVDVAALPARATIGADAANGGGVAVAADAAPAAPIRPMNSPSASCTACAAFCSESSLSRISSSSGSRSRVG